MINNIYSIVKMLGFGAFGEIHLAYDMNLKAFIIIYVISMFLDRFLEIAWIANAFKGIRVAVGLLILDVGIRMVKKMPKEPLRIVLTVCAVLATLAISVFSLKISTIVLLLAAGVISLAVFLIEKPREEKGGEQQ